jgi:hypothetical protein
MNKKTIVISLSSGRLECPNITRNDRRRQISATNTQNETTTTQHALVYIYTKNYNLKLKEREKVNDGEKKRRNPNITHITI